MAYLHPDVLDGGLSVLTDDATRIDLCSSEPATYAGALSASLGGKTGHSVGAPEAAAGGARKVVSAAVTDGVVTATGTASHWALLDPVGERLLAAGELSASQLVTDGNDWALSAFDAVTLAGVGS